MIQNGKMYMYDTLFFSEEASLGDAFVHNAIVHHFANTCRTLCYPATDTNFATITTLYKDYPNIVVMHKQQYHDKIARHKEDQNSYHLTKFPLFPVAVRYENDAFEHIVVNWERQCYEMFDLPFSLRYTGARIPSPYRAAWDLYDKLAGQVNYEDYALVSRHMGVEQQRLDFHVEPFTGDLRVIEMDPNITNNLLDWLVLIEEATQIHCPPSAVHQLVDSMLDRTDATLFFHHVRKNYMGQVNGPLHGNVWNLVNYTTKY